MAFDDLELQRIDDTVGALCRRRSPAWLKDELQTTYEIRGHSVCVYETRPDWRDPNEWTMRGIAKFRYIRTRGEWKLYWMRRDLKWHAYDPYEMPRDLESLVRIVDKDRYGAFFG